MNKCISNIFFSVRIFLKLVKLNYIFRKNKWSLASMNFYQYISFLHAINYNVLTNLTCPCKKTYARDFVLTASSASYIINLLAAF